MLRKSEQFHELPGMFWAVGGDWKVRPWFFKVGFLPSASLLGFHHGTTHRSKSCVLAVAFLDTNYAFSSIQTKGCGFNSLFEAFQPSFVYGVPDHLANLFPFHPVMFNSYFFVFSFPSWPIKILTMWFKLTFLRVILYLRILFVLVTHSSSFASSSSHAVPGAKQIFTMIWWWSNYLSLEIYQNRYWQWISIISSFVCLRGFF